MRGGSQVEAIFVPSFQDGDVQVGEVVPGLPVQQLVQGITALDSLNTRHSTVTASHCLRPSSVTSVRHMAYPEVQHTAG